MKGITVNVKYNFRVFELNFSPYDTFQQIKDLLQKVNKINTVSSHQ